MSLSKTEQEFTHTPCIPDVLNCYFGPQYVPDTLKIVFFTSIHSKQAKTITVLGSQHFSKLPYSFG
jgi:hypothetical protein